MADVAKELLYFRSASIQVVCVYPRQVVGWEPNERSHRSKGSLVGLDRRTGCRGRTCRRTAVHRELQSVRSAGACLQAPVRNPEVGNHRRDHRLGGDPRDCRRRSRPSRGYPARPPSHRIRLAPCPVDGSAGSSGRGQYGPAGYRRSGRQGSGLSGAWRPDASQSARSRCSGSRGR